jgi:molybdopterin-guanine dinucleotide biosynthesis protein A
LTAGSSEAARCTIATVRVDDLVGPAIRPACQTAGMVTERPAGRPRLGAVVLAGGAAARLGGADKAAVEAGGRTLLAHALDALVDVDDVVVVGPDVPTERPVTFRREDPPGGGPAAAVVAGLTGFVRLPERVAVLAVDMPRVRPATIRRLADAAATADGAVLVDDGRRQHLCGVYDAALLVAAGAGDTHGLAVHELLRTFDLVEVAAEGAEARDIDTWDDVRAWREELEGR